jgi:hypothetical protein
MRNKIIKLLREFYEKGHSFDWDDNILNMDTKIHLEKKVDGEWQDYDVSTEEFRNERHKIDNENMRLKSNAFEDFTTDIFVKHTEDAINNNDFGPSFEDFKEALINGSDFSIITARGVTKQTLIAGIKKLIDLSFSEDEKIEMKKSLGKRRLSLDRYIGRLILAAVSSQEFKNEYKSESGAENPETAKPLAFEKYVEKFVKSKLRKKSSGMEGIKIGFSDDDKANLIKMEQFIVSKLLDKYPMVTFVLIDTSNPNNVTKKILNYKKKEELQLETRIKKILNKILY